MKPLAPATRHKLTVQARLCESCNHWVMAAIVWRKLGDEKKADACENILDNLAINPNFVLIKKENEERLADLVNSVLKEGD
jgi:hypothetical protein